MESITAKAKQLHRSVEEIIYHFQCVNAAASELVQNLSIGEIKSIVLLGQRGHCIMREIADYLRIAVSTVTGLVDKLEEKNLVTRERSDEDRRIINISLTPQGEEIYRFHTGELTKLCRGMLIGMTNEEQDTYIELSKKIALGARENFSRNGSEN